MKIDTTSKESATAVKAGEPTAAKADKVTLTAEGMTDLLKSEFAAEAKTTGTTPAKEIPAAGGTVVVDDESKIVEQPGEGEETPEAKAERERVEAETAATELTARAEAAGVTVEEQAEAELAERAQEAGVDIEEQRAAEAAAASGEQPGEGDAPLPEEAQAALAAWEETGGALPAPLQALVDKRIGKLTGAARTEKERADRAEASLATVTAEAAALRADPNRPAYLTPNSVTTEQQLDKVAATAKRFVTMAENFLDDSATDDERATVEKYLASERLDEKGLKRKVREANEFLTQELPQQRAQVQQFRAQETKAVQASTAYFPFLNDKTTPEFAEAQRILTIVPELTQRTPAHQFSLGTFVLGNKVITHLQNAGIHADLMPKVMAAIVKAFPIAAAPKTAAAKTPPPKTPAGKSAAVQKPGKTSAVEAASQKFNKNLNRQTATDLARAALMGA